MTEDQVPEDPVPEGGFGGQEADFGGQNGGSYF